jgi:hypothetical protein
MWARVGPLSHCRMLSRYCIMRASTPHTIAPHVTMPHPTLAHAPISIEPSLFQDTHVMRKMRIKVRFCLDERLHDLAVAMFCRQVQRCVVALIYIYKCTYIYNTKYKIYNIYIYYISACLRGMGVSTGGKTVVNIF